MSSVTFAVPSGRIPRVASFERPFTTSFTVAPGGDDESAAGHGGELGGVVRALSVKDLDLQAAGAQGFGEALEVTLISRAPRVGVADDDRFHRHTISPIIASYPVVTR